MLKKCFSVGGFVALASVVTVWAGCSSDATPASTANNDAGTDSTLDSGSNGTNTVDSGSNNGLAGGVNITYGACATFAKCGGNVVGDWKVTGGCLSPDTFTDAKAQCPGLQESNVVIQASGTLDFTATNVTRDTTIALTGSVFIPLGGTCPATTNYSCGILGIGLTSKDLAPGGLYFDSATCTDATTPSKGCNCNVAKKITDASTQTYVTTTDGTLTTTSSSTPPASQTFDYCINGTTDTYFETTQGQSLKLYVTIGK